MRSKQYFTSIKNNPHEISTDPVLILSSKYVSKEYIKEKSILDFLQNAFNLLGYSDSNQEKQDQNLLCYHYTIAQTYIYGILSMKTSAFVRCWATRTRTKKNRTRICCVTITP